MLSVGAPKDPLPSLEAREARVEAQVVACSDFVRRVVRSIQGLGVVGEALGVTLRKWRWAVVPGSGVGVLTLVALVF